MKKILSILSFLFYTTIFLYSGELFRNGTEYSDSGHYKFWYGLDGMWGDWSLSFSIPSIVYKLDNQTFYVKKGTQLKNISCTPLGYGLYPMTGHDCLLLFDNSYFDGKSYTINKNTTIVHKLRITKSISKKVKEKILATVNIYVDETPPSLSITGHDEKWHREAQSIEITITDSTQDAVSSGLYTVNIPDVCVYNDATKKYTVSHEGKNNIKITAYDNVLNYAEKSITVKIDTTVPVLNIDGEKTGWQKDDVTLSVNVTDVTSGVKRIIVKDMFYSGRDKTGAGSEITKELYTFNGISDTGENRVTKTYTVSQSGVHEIIFEAEDVAGNSIKSETPIIIKIDKEHPSITATSGDYGFDTWTNNKNVEIQLEVKDEHSGVSNVWINDESNEKTLDKDGKVSLTVTAEGTTTLKPYARDNVGNQTVNPESYTVRIDTTPPTISVNLSDSSDTSRKYEGDWVKNNVKAVIDFADSTSGIDSTTIEITDEFKGKEEKVDFTTGEHDLQKFFVLKEEGIHKIKAYVKDYAGNPQTTETYEIKIDKKEIAEDDVKLSTEFMTEEIENNNTVINNSERFGGNLKTFIVNVEKEAANASKPNTVEISLDGKKNTYNLTAKSDNSGYEYRLDVSGLAEKLYEFEVNVIDEAGNGMTSTVKQNVTIDRTAMVPTAEGLSGESSDGTEVNITLSNLADTKRLLSHDGSGKITVVYHMPVDNSLAEAITNSILRDKREDGVYAVDAENIDEYGNPSRKTVYLLWRDGEEGPAESAVTRGYENTKEGLKSYIEFPAETYTAEVGTSNKVYERTYKVYGSTGSAAEAKECIQSDGKIRLYLTGQNKLQEVINWKGSEADRTVKLFYSEVYKPTAGERSTIKGQNGTSKATEYFIEDLAPVVNPCLKFVDYAGQKITFTCVPASGYTGFSAMAEDPDGDPLLYRVTFKNNAGEEKSVFITGLGNGIELPEDFDYSSGLNVKVEIKGIRQGIGDDETKFEELWNDETVPCTAIEKTYEASRIDSKIPELKEYDEEYWKEVPEWTARTVSDFVFTDEESGINTVIVEYKTVEENEEKTVLKDTVILSEAKEYTYTVDLTKLGAELSGKYAVAFAVTDMTENDLVYSSNPVTVDTKKPEIKTVTQETDKDGDVKLDITADDGNGSGVKQYSIKTESETEWEDWRAYTGGRSVYVSRERFSGNGRKLSVKVRDTVGNESSEKTVESESYEKISEIESVTLKGINGKGYVTERETLDVEIKFEDESKSSDYKINWILKNVSDGKENTYDSIEALRAAVEDGKEYSIRVNAENAKGSRSEKKGDRSFIVETSSPAPIKVRTASKDIVRGKKHEIIVEGGLDATCPAERTVHVVKKSSDGSYEEIYRKTLETGENKETVRIETGLYEEEIKAGALAIYAESENEAGLVTQSEKLTGFKLKESTGLVVEADEYTAGSLYVRWSTENGETAGYEYIVETESGEELGRGNTSETAAVYDIKESLSHGTLLYVTVKGYTEDGEEIESGKSDAVMFCTEHPKGKWTKVPAAVLSTEAWAEYKIEKGIGIKTKACALEVYEKDSEGNWNWNGTDVNGEDNWTELKAEQGKINVNLSGMKTEGRIKDGSHIRFVLSMENKAGFETQVTTGGIAVDDSLPPVPVTLDQGDVVNQVKKEGLYVDWSTSFSDPESGSTYYWRWYLNNEEDRDSREWVEADWNDERTEQQMIGVIGDDIKDEKYDGRILYFEVKAVNGAGAETVGRTDGIILDSNAPVIEEVKVYVSESMSSTSQIKGYTETEKVGEYIYLKITAADITSWSESAEAVLHEISEEGMKTQKNKVELEVKDNTATARINVKDLLDIKDGTRFEITATAKDAAGNRSGSAVSGGIVLVGSPVKVETVNIQGDTVNLNINWTTTGDNRWTKEYMVKVSYPEKNMNEIYHTKTTSLSVDWKDIGIMLNESENGTSVSVTVTPIGYVSRPEGEEGKTENFMLDFTIPEFDENEKCIPADIELTAWAEHVTAYVRYITGVTGASVQWASNYAADGSELTSWEKKRNASSLKVNKSINELNEAKKAEFWHNKYVMLRFRAVNQMGLSSIEKKVTPVLIDITKPDLAEISRDWVWTNKAGTLDEIKIRGKDSESGLSGYISALIKKTDTESEETMIQSLQKESVSTQKIYVKGNETYEDEQATIPIVGIEEGMYKAVLGIRSGSGLWTYVSSEDIEVDRTPPVFRAEKTSFSGAEKQTVKIGEDDVTVYVTNGPAQEYKLYSSEENLWKINIDTPSAIEMNVAEYQDMAEGTVDFNLNPDGRLYKVSVEMTDRAGNTGTGFEYLRYNSAPAVTVLYDENEDGSKSDKIIVWPGHTKSISELFSITDFEQVTDGDYPLTYTWIPGNGDENHTWTGGNSKIDILGSDGEYRTAYYQESEKAQVSRYTGYLKVQDRYGKESITEVEITVENTREGKLIVDEYWTGEYVITGKVVVPEGKVLILENADVTADGKADGSVLDSGFDVYGRMETSGKVTMKSGNPLMKWKGIKIGGTLIGDSLYIEEGQRGLTVLEKGIVELDELEIKTALTGLHLMGGVFNCKKMNINNCKQYGIKEESAGQYDYGNIEFHNNGRNLYKDGFTE